jgi:hypothetical protein
VLSRTCAVLFCTILLAVLFYTFVRASFVDEKTSQENTPTRECLFIRIGSRRNAKTTEVSMSSIGFLEQPALLEFDLEQRGEGNWNQGTTTKSLRITIQRGAEPCQKVANTPRFFGARHVTSQINFFALETAWQHSCQYQMRLILLPRRAKNTPLITATVNFPNWL